jgi:hypothetical protein
MVMDEAKIMELLTDNTANVLGLLSIYFTVVSAYIAALYYFLHRAPVLMKAAAITMLTGALMFLGFAALGIERMLSGLFFAMAALPAEARHALAPNHSGLFSAGAEVLLTNAYAFGVWLGWVMAALVYMAMVYLTFVHHWSPREET